MNTDGLDEIAESAREHFTAKHGAREKALPLCRETVRLSANAIRCVHRRDFAAAAELIVRAAANLKEMDSALAQHPDILNAGYVHDAQKEYVEAATTLALIAGRPLPSPDDLGVLAAAYMNGIAETIGELRRHLLDSLREGDVQHCEDTLGAMGDIYDVLVTMDFPEAVTSGLRRSTDAMRGILERTRGDFTMAAVQRELEEKLDEFGKRLAN
ncbi:MAG: haloacid dehalogenase [Chloroflexi bacterium]|nr:haloacid dehalogenase [Chloroflexota bacterium]